MDNTVLSQMVHQHHITKDALESSGEVKRMKTNSNLASAFNNGNGDTY